MVRYEIERLANGVLDAMPEDPYPLRVMQARHAAAACHARGAFPGAKALLHAYQLSLGGYLRRAANGSAVVLLQSCR